MTHQRMFTVSFYSYGSFIGGYYFSALNSEPVRK